MQNFYCDPRNFDSVKQLLRSLTCFVVSFPGSTFAGTGTAAFFFFSLTGLFFDGSKLIFDL